MDTPPRTRRPAPRFASAARAACTAAVLACVHSSFALAEPRLTPLQPDDHFRHPMKDSYYTENWNFQMLMDSGDLVYLSWLVSNIGVFSGSAGVHVTYAPAGGKGLFLKEEGKLSEYSEDRAADVISIGRSSIARRDGRVHLTARIGRFSADLTLTPWMPGFRHAEDRIALDSKGRFHQTFFEIPRADVEGTVSLDGVSRQVRGSAYMDHALQNATATDFSYRWYALRAFYPEHTVLLLQCFRKPAAEGRSWRIGIVTDRKRVLSVSTDFKLATSGEWKDPKGYAVPAHYQVDVPGGVAVAGTYREKGLLHRGAILEQLNWAERRVVSLFAGNPIMYRFRAEAPLVLQTGGARIELKGPAFHEVSMLGDEQPPVGH